MDATSTLTLKRAMRLFRSCAQIVKSKAISGRPTPVEFERIVGLGIASDWLNWAQALKSMTYSDRRLAKSRRRYGLQELTRFTFMWTATNALFARPAILNLLGGNLGAKLPELDRFRVLLQKSSLPATDVTSYESKLHSLLATEMQVEHFPWSARVGPVTTLEVIYHKYTVASEQARGVGKKLHHAATAKNYSGLDLATLIYATRNWNIHGVLITTSFRGPEQKFNLWIDTVNAALARILDGVALALQSAV